MPVLNPYDSPSVSRTDVGLEASRGPVVGITAFAIVLVVAALAGAIGPAVAHIAGAPIEFTVSILQTSMAACLPFGVVLAYFANRCARRRIGVARICWFFLILLVIVPLALDPRTAGPLVEYIGLGMVVTVVAALVAGGALRRYTPTAVLPEQQ